MLTRQQRGSWATLVLIPPLVVVALVLGALPDPRFGAPLSHFYLVTATTILLGIIALLMVSVALRVADLRVTLLALAFLSIAGILLGHALTTPTALVPYTNGWVSFSAPFSIFLGAIFLAFSTRDWSPHAGAFLLRWQRPLFFAVCALIVAYNVVAVVSASQPPTGPVAAAPPASTSSTVAASYDGYGGYGEQAGHAAHMPAASSSASPTRFDALLGNKALQRGIAAFTVGCLGFAIWRYWRRYRLARSPLVAGLLAAAIFLAQAQVIMVTTAMWHASWWSYHLLILAAFCAAAIGLAREYARSGTLTGVVQGLLLQDTIRQLEHGYAEVITALVAAVEAKDLYTRGHTQRVAELSIRIGQRIGLSPEQLRVLGQAAILHDIGKIGVPDAILNKPGPLTEEEFAIVREHPVRGYEIIEGIRSLARELGGIRSHHERMDGSGYPDGLRGEAIPLEARIIAVADVYDALTSRRPYREAATVEQALRIIGTEAGPRLDPLCVAALRQVLAGERVFTPGMQPGTSGSAPYSTQAAD